MKKISLVFIGLMAASFLPLLAAEDGYYRYQFARLQYVQGDVVLQRAEGEEEAAEVNFVLAEGNILMTKDGRAEVSLGRRNDLRLDRWTQVEFVRLPKDEDGKTGLRILEGSSYLRVRRLPREKGFEVHTADASFYLLEEGLYRFDVTPDETEFTVIEGAGEVAGDERSVVLERNERLVAARGELGSTMRSLLEEDSFASWNRERDTLETRASSRGYLPSELEEYEEELAENGRWVYERPWGYVWVPYIIYSDWRPYYYGRWLWYPVIGWTWVPYEPWGWCVFHFGRWHWRFGLGWYWIPTTYWGPAWVHWWMDYDYLGWVPLSYYNRPVVIVNNFFYDRFYDSVYPIHSRALTVVRKDQLMAPRVHEVALRDNQVVSLRHLSLRAVRANEVNSLIRPENLKGISGQPSISRERITPSAKVSGASPEARIVRRENLNSGVSSQGVRTSVPQNRAPAGSIRESGGGQIRPSREKIESPRISSRTEGSDRALAPARSPNEAVDRRIRPEGASSGVKVSPTPSPTVKREIRQDSNSRSIRRKDEEESSRPSRLNSSLSSSSVKSRVEANFSGRTSPSSYLRSRLAEQVFPSRSPERSRSIIGSGSSSSISSSLPRVTRIPSSSPAPRVSVPSFSQRSGSFSAPRSLSPTKSFSPSFSRPAAPSSPPSSGKIIKKK